MFTISPFSVSQTRKVVFSPANLKAFIGRDGALHNLKFTENQFDLFHSNGLIGANYEKGFEIDLFGFSTSSNGAIFSISPFDYMGTFEDWGKLLASSSGRWRTLSGGSGSEWVYLMNVRKCVTHGIDGNTNVRYAYAQINGVNGILIFPDFFIWKTEMGIAPKDVNVCSLFSNNMYTLDNFKEMEKYGMVFLPACGKRKGNMISSSNQEGNYWSSTPNGINMACSLKFSEKGMQSWCFKSERCIGASVRLVQDIDESGL